MNCWDEWARLTRFLESARIAFKREAQMWASLELRDPSSAVIHVEDGEATYTVKIEQHRAAVADEWLLLGLVMIESYALTESAAAEKLGVAQLNDAIEVWGARLLDAAGNTWSDVKGGRAGAVEAAVVRNAIAHGDRTYSARAANRLAAVGLERAAGDAVVLDYVTLREYRARLKSLLRAGQI